MADFTIPDGDFFSSKRSQERVYRDEGGRQLKSTYLDALGHARWDTDYYTLRRAGYTPEAAEQEVRCRIREAWLPPLPALEPHPPVPTPSPVPVPPPVNPGVKGTMERFAACYLARTRETGFKPDASTSHEQQMMFLRETILAFRQATGDVSFVMKRASTARPISNEVVVFTVGVDPADYRRFWDFIAGAGSADWRVHADGPGQILPSDQILVDPVTLDNMPG